MLWRSRRNWYGLLAVAVFAACVGRQAKDPSHPGSPPQLRIELRVARPVIRTNEYLEYEAELVNDGPAPVTVVMPGDDSSDGWRTPVVIWSPPLERGMRCGNVNVLRPSEVISLGAGQRVKLQWLDAPRFETPGRYAVSLQLENIPDLEWSGIPLGNHDEGTMARVRLTPPFKAVSNVVLIEVET